jgi:NAD(P)-dependent dehydrogenase (short-subunit alcohol dehydrogenase family)
MSKAALNMGMQALGEDLKSAGVVVAVVAPGAVDTEMHATFAANYHAQGQPISAQASVTGMTAVIDGLDRAKAIQGVIGYNGSIHPC